MSSFDPLAPSERPGVQRGHDCCRYGVRLRCPCGLDRGYIQHDEDFYGEGDAFGSCSGTP